MNIIPLRHHVLALALGLVAGLAQAQDRVTYRDRAANKDTEATGTVQSESANRVVIKGTTTREVPALDVVDVTYEVPGAVRLDYGRLATQEKRLESITKDDDRKKAVAELLKSYQEMLPRLAGEKTRFAHRQVQFKIAQLLARQAEDDPARLGAAIEALSAFLKEQPDSWQVTACARLLGRLQIEKGDAEGARKTYAALAAVPNLPKEAKQDCELLTAQALIEGKQYAEAQQKLQALQAAVAGDAAQTARVQVYLAACQAGAGDLTKAVPQLEGIIAKTTDPALKAAAYNALGDSYRLNGRPKEALWAYLWVDVLYHQDRQEHTRAILHLAKLFDELGDGARAAQYRDKLKRADIR